MSEWQPIETAPKDGRLILLGVDYQRGGYDRVRCGFWLHSSRERWILKDQNTQVRGGNEDTSHWRIFLSEDAGCTEWADADEGVFIRYFEPTHWLPLPVPPEPAP